jgi:hypothetical protein
MIRTRLLVWALCACCASGAQGRQWAPVQPIPFSHRVHAGTNRIGCLLCHAYVEHAPDAGIPSMSRCAACHKFSDSDKPEIRSFLQDYREKKVVSWVEVYRLQDFVYFTHERHVASGLRCQQCHGEVQEMDVLEEASPMTMGWCVDCHRLKGAPTECLTCHK